MLFDKKPDPLDSISVSNGGAFGRSTNTAIHAGLFGGSGGGFNGSKFFDGFGKSRPQKLNYWALRHRSSEIFATNMYARGIIRTLVTNKINRGINLESIPLDEVLGISYEESNKWQEQVESRFRIWGNSPELCDFKGMQTFWAFQEAAEVEAMVSGDCLVIMVGTDPKIVLVPGNEIETPLKEPKAKGQAIENGVHYDRKTGAVLGFWVRKSDGVGFTYIKAKNSAGEVVAFLYYANDKRYRAFRGEPMFSLYLQSLKSIDEYRDSAQAAGARASEMMAFVERSNADVISSNGIATGGGATLSTERQIDTENGPANYHTTEISPGTVINSLAVGETIKAFQGQGHVDFGAFERTIVSTVAWTDNIPPEVLLKSYNSNYAASAGAKEEFKMYLDMSRTRSGEIFYGRVFRFWVINQHLKGKIKNDQFLMDYRNPDRYKFNAWINCDWTGAIKSSTDVFKMTKAYELQMSLGLITGHKATRELNGTKFSENLKQLRRENEKKIEAARPLAEFEKEFGKEATARAFGILDKMAIDKSHEILLNEIEKQEAE